MDVPWRLGEDLTVPTPHHITSGRCPVSHCGHQEPFLITAAADSTLSGHPRTRLQPHSLKEIMNERWSHLPSLLMTQASALTLHRAPSNARRSRTDIFRASQTDWFCSIRKNSIPESLFVWLDLTEKNVKHTQPARLRSRVTLGSLPGLRRKRLHKLRREKGKVFKWASWLYFLFAELEKRRRFRASPRSWRSLVASAEVPPQLKHLQCGSHSGETLEQRAE